jgi:iron complex outermembrane receptor protein/vitamin B12 transporter
MIREIRWSVVGIALLVVLTTGAAAYGQQQSSVVGVVEDPLGARVTGATVTLIGERGQAGETTSGADGAYAFRNVVPGRYQVLVRAAGFEPLTSEPVFVGRGAQASVEVTLQIGPLQQSVVVTAATAEVSQAQTGAPITVLDERTLDALNKPDLLEAIRLVPGAQIVQVGARGATTGLFIRGGNSNFNKVLVDGIPTNDIGGGFDFAQLSTAGVERVEVLRQTNSVMYGSDALAGVVNITTRRGRTRIPEFDYSADGGNLGTFSTAASLGGAFKRVDYFSSYSRFETDNNVPNNGYSNGTFAARFGAAVGGGTDLSVSVRRIDTEYGSANAFNLYRIADDSSQDKDQTYFSASARSQWTDRLQSTLRFGWTNEESLYVNPTPSGTPFDPFGFGANYLGETVTLTGASGRTVTGQAILDFGGDYPQPFASRTMRKIVVGDTTVQVTDAVSISGGGRFEREEGFAVPDDPATETRNNGGLFVEGRGAFMNRHYISLGLGYEHNKVFESAVTPRLSIASYLRQPTATGAGETKLTLNAGSGIKASSVFQGQNSLFALVQGTPAGTGIEPVGPERSTSFDVGVEQGFASGRARARVSYFHNTFEDLLEYLSPTILTTRLGVPAEAANATGFGAYVNAASFRAQGIETSGEGQIGNVRFMASYTYLDAEVTEGFSASTSFNPAFPDIAIGAFSPLVGERPFRRPANSGTLMVSYVRGPGQVTLSGYFAGKRDDSTFLSDPFFGNSMLLPNQDLAAAYQKIDLSGSYQIHRRLRGYASIENLLDQDYEAAFGFPALPLTARVGFRVTLGGD